MLRKISSDQLLTLNDKVLQHSGKIEESLELEKCVMNLQESNGCSVTVSDPSPNYMKKITTVLGVQEGISLVNPKGAHPQGTQRQMIGSSLRNLASQIATTLCSVFEKKI